MIRQAKRKPKKRRKTTPNVFSIHHPFQRCTHSHYASPQLEPNAMSLLYSLRCAQRKTTQAPNDDLPMMQRCRKLHKNHCIYACAFCCTVLWSKQWCAHKNNPNKSQIGKLKKQSFFMKRFNPLFHLGKKQGIRIFSPSLDAPSTDAFE